MEQTADRCTLHFRDDFHTFIPSDARPRPPSLILFSLGPGQPSMLRVGAILLSLWTGFNLVLALGILFMLLVLGKNAPALLILYGDLGAEGMDPRALSTINALAVMFNACAASICALSLAMIWFAIVRKAVWAFWCLAGCLGFLQAAGFASDTFLGNKDVLANAISSLLLFCGIFSVGIAILYVRDTA